MTRKIDQKPFVAPPATASIDAGENKSPAKDTKPAAQTPADPPRKTITFAIPVRLSASAGQITSASSVLAGGKVDPSDAVVGVPMPPEAIGVLKTWFAKDGDTYVVSDAQANATKRALLAWWGFPETFVKTKFDLLKLNQRDKSNVSAIDSDNRVTGNIGGVSLEGWTNKNDDWTKSSIAAIIASLAPPKAATSLSLHESFFERLGINAEASRTKLNQKLLAVLVNWKTVSNLEVAWAKSTIMAGLGISGELQLEGRAEGGSALADDHSIQGVLKTTEPGKTSVGAFAADLEKGIMLNAPGFSIGSIRFSDS